MGRVGMCINPTRERGIMTKRLTPLFNTWTSEGISVVIRPTFISDRLDYSPWSLMTTEVWNPTYSSVTQPKKVKVKTITVPKETSLQNTLNWGVMRNKTTTLKTGVDKSSLIPPPTHCTSLTHSWNPLHWFSRFFLEESRRTQRKSVVQSLRGKISFFSRKIFAILFRKI